MDRPILDYQSDRHSNSESIAADPALYFFVSASFVSVTATITLLRWGVAPPDVLDAPPCMTGGMYGTIPLLPALVLSFCNYVRRSYAGRRGRLATSKTTLLLGATWALMSVATIELPGIIAGIVSAILLFVFPAVVSWIVLRFPTADDSAPP